MPELRRRATEIGLSADPCRNIAHENSSGAIPSPGLVLWEIGRVIAVCLALAVAANLLAAVLPAP